MTEHELEKSIQDFRYFLVKTWEHLRLPAPTRMQLYIADYLQEGHRRSQLQALRGIGKTWITGAFVAWRLLRDPNEKVLIISQSGGMADQIAIFIRKLIDTMPILEHLKPRPDQRSSVLAFDVNGCNIAVQPSVKSLGITSQLQGNRATLLISDDVEGQQNSATEVRREQLLHQVAEYEAILQTDEKSQILMLGTPQSSESIYNKMRDKGYVTRIYPARYPETIANYEGCLADYLIQDIAKDPNLLGTSCDTRFSEEDLIAREQSYGKSGFKLQFMLDTTLSDAERYPLKTSDIILTDLEPELCSTGIRYSSQDIIDTIPNVGFTGDRLYRGKVNEESIPYEGKALFVDPAGRGKDETAVAVVNHLHGKLPIPYIGGIEGGYDDGALIQIAELAKEYQVEKIVVESNFGDGMFSSLLQPVVNAIYPVTIDEIRVNTQKELRIIDTLEPVLNSHRLILDYNNIKQDTEKCLTANAKDIVYSFLYQLTHITKDKGSLLHDDKLDVVALGVQYWLDYGILKQDSHIALDRYKKKQFLSDVMAIKRRTQNNNGRSNIGSTLSKLRGYK